MYTKTAFRRVSGEKVTLQIRLGAFLVERLFFPKIKRNDQERSQRSEKKNERLERVLKKFETVSKRTERELLEKNG